jgi:hypothetical protein
MNEVDRNLSAAYVRAKDAGTLILVDRSGRVPRVLLGKRHAGHAFMPGKYVFPGGRVDRSDARVPVARPLAPELEALLMKRVPRARAPSRLERWRSRRFGRPSKKPASWWVNLGPTPF